MELSFNGNERKIILWGKLHPYTQGNIIPVTARMLPQNERYDILFFSPLNYSVLLDVLFIHVDIPLAFLFISRAVAFTSSQPNEIV